MSMNVLYITPPVISALIQMAATTAHVTKASLSSMIRCVQVPSLELPSQKRITFDFTFIVWCLVAFDFAKGDSELVFSPSYCYTVWSAIGSSLLSSLCLSVRLSVCLWCCAFWLSGLVYAAKSYTSVFLA